MADLNYVTDPSHRFYIVFGQRSAQSRAENEQLSLVRADGTGRVVLPIARNTVQYDVSNDSFLIFVSLLEDRDPGPFPNDFKIWRESNCLPIWRVEPETSKVDQNCIPYGPWVGEPTPDKRTGAIIELAPTKAGLFFSYHRPSGISGLYKFENGSVRHIFGGEATHPVVSPSGCRVAFTHIPSFDAYKWTTPVVSTIVAVDVCPQNP